MGKAAEYFTVDARTVWASAAAAFRINDRQYLKEPKYDHTGKQLYVPNRIIFNQLVIQPELLLESDYSDGLSNRRYFQQQTFKMLSGEWMNPFVQEAIPIAELEEFCPDKQRQYIGMIVCLPNVVVREKKMDEMNNRLKLATGYVGKIGERYTMNLHVVKCVFSHNYSRYFVSGLTENNERVLFALKEKFDLDTIITIIATVSWHRDNITKLTHTKVL